MGPTPHTATWKWLVCAQLLLATMINYMDRQTLSQMATDIQNDFRQRGIPFTDRDYGNLELGFGIAFALGAAATGLVVDRVNTRWMYPAVLLGWSAAGFATGWATDYRSLFLCRSVLGFLEAGQWPCALITIQRILARQDRTLGNGVMQSGAALGAILTPLVVQLMLTDDPGSWRRPFQVIGALGIIWVVAWFSLIRRDDLAIPEGKGPTPNADLDPHSREAPALPKAVFARRLLTLMIVAVAINLCWHFFRAWLPKFLREYHHYDRHTVNNFTMAYYLATDLGSLAVGVATLRLIERSWTVHRARLLLFFLCALITALSMLAAALPAGPLLLATLLVIGFGALGLFPNYYAFSQELTLRHQGKISGTLGCVTWTCTALMHPLVGQRIDETHSYAAGLFWAGLMPMIGVVALVALWGAKGTGADIQPTHRA
jgi:ACS family hexuronate transporter-like MFS transporter